VQATPITVEDHDLRDVEVPLPLRADITVHVRSIDENENVLPNPTDYNAIRMELRSPAGYASSSGLRALVPEGSYSVSLRALPAGYVLKSITSGGRDLSQTLLDIDLSVTKIDIEATLQLQKR